MSYSTRKIYTFMPELSIGDPKKDNITTVNVPLLSAYHQKRDADMWGKFLLGMLIDK